MSLWSRRRFLAISAATTALSSAISPGARAALGSRRLDSRWIDAWGASLSATLRNGALDPVPTFDRQTLRVILFSKLGGTRARVKFTNRFQTEPLRIGARIALRDGAARRDDHRRNGSCAVLRRAFVSHTSTRRGTLERSRRSRGAAARRCGRQSVPADSELLPRPRCMERVPRPASSRLRATTLAPSRCRRRSAHDTTVMVFFVAGLQVMAPARTQVIVAFGDSITDGAASEVDGNASWPDVLSLRLPALRNGAPVSVINMGIGSNRLVASDRAGPSGVKRFSDDVLARPNVSHVIVLEGVNDISYEHAPPEQLIVAYQSLIARARARNIKVVWRHAAPDTEIGQRHAAGTRRLARR